MRDVTRNEMVIVLTIAKNPSTAYNANNIAKQIGISSMGALKIMKRLEKEGVLISTSMGKSNFYKFNFANDYAVGYLVFLLKREAEQSSAYIKMWINEIRKIKKADIAILFGSVLRVESKANDVDVLFVTDGNRIEKLKKEIKEINRINEKEIHPIFQNSHDIKYNIGKKDKTVLNAIKGIVAFGYENFIEVLK